MTAIDFAWKTGILTVLLFLSSNSRKMRQAIGLSASKAVVLTHLLQTTSGLVAYAEAIEENRDMIGMIDRV